MDMDIIEGLLKTIFSFVDYVLMGFFIGTGFILSLKLFGLW